MTSVHAACWPLGTAVEQADEQVCELGTDCSGQPQLWRKSQDSARCGGGGCCLHFHGTAQGEYVGGAAKPERTCGHVSSRACRN